MEKLLTRDFQMIDSVEEEIDSILQTNKKRRKCKMSNCITILESYNEEEYCHCHQRLVNIIKQNEFIKSFDKPKSKR